MAITLREQIQISLRSVTYKDWRFLVAEDGSYLQVQFMDGQIPQAGRKWWMSTYMTHSEIVQTAFKAVLTAEEHEVREQFKYADHAIFGPHINVDRLWDVCVKTSEQN